MNRRDYRAIETEPRDWALFLVLLALSSATLIGLVWMTVIVIGHVIDAFRH